MGLKEKMQNYDPEADEEMTVTIYLEDDTEIECGIATILTVQNQDYIYLIPLDDSGEVLIYGYSENPENSNEEPELRNITDDEEYEIASDAFDEYLDECEFDELVEEDEDEE